MPGAKKRSSASRLKILGMNATFPGCCGATILHGLSASAVVINHAAKTESAQFATTVPSQVEEIEALRAARFKPLVQWWNGNTDHIVTLWGRGALRTVDKEFITDDEG